VIVWQYGRLQFLGRFNYRERAAPIAAGGASPTPDSRPLSWGAGSSGTPNARRIIGHGARTTHTSAVRWVVVRRKNLRWSRCGARRRSRLALTMKSRNPDRWNDANRGRTYITIGPESGARHAIFAKHSLTTQRVYEPWPSRHRGSGRARTALPAGLPFTTVRTQAPAGLLRR